MRLIRLVPGLAVLAALAACGQDKGLGVHEEDTPSGSAKLTVSSRAVGGTCELCAQGRLTLNIQGLEDLGPQARYEGWIIVNGSPVSTGLFSVDAEGEMSRKAFFVERADLAAAAAFVLTIEPVPDPDPAPSAVHLLGGDFSGSRAALSIGHPAALGNDFSKAAGQFILATPTDNSTSNENSGIWFLVSGQAGLVLPTLPAGWVYEGWAVINGVPVTTGTFTSPSGADASAPFSGPNAGPPFPGEDFLVNAPAGLSFPTNLAGGMAVISIEPSPDNSSAPFTLKPLVGPIPANATDHTAYPMNLNAGSFPTGTAAR
jgi:hypothetical protein